MQLLRVRHLTRYRYARPVRFGEHRLMLRPCEHPDQTVVRERMTITPRPLDLSFERDALGNWIGLARFEGAAKELCFESEVQVARRPIPPRPTEDGPSAHPHFARAFRAGADGAVALWARGFLPGADVQPGVASLAAMSRAIHDDFHYRRRLEHGVQTPAQTLATRAGACRDFAMLMIAAARALGFQARFVSGYVHCPDEPGSARRPGGGHTHAWASVRTPEQGWIDFDPTSGAVGPEGMIRVAVADEPSQAIPIQGVYFGGADDFLGMDVEVDVISDATSTFIAAVREPDQLQRVGWSAA